MGDVGDGLQEIVISMVSFYLLRPQVLLWDDFESHKNPHLIAFTLDWLRRLVEDEGVQVILATHSLDVIQSATELMKDKDWFNILLLDIEEGRLNAKKLSADDVIHLKEAGIDVRLAYPIL